MAMCVMSFAHPHIVPLCPPLSAPLYHHSDKATVLFPQTSSSSPSLPPPLRSSWPLWRKPHARSSNSKRAPPPPSPP